MRKIFCGIFGFSLLLALAACKQDTAPQANKQALPAPVEAVENSLDGTFCFSNRFNQDATDVQLTILDGAVTGKMDWIPYEKDSARGTLRGYENAAHELDLLYDYVIEGSQQTETKIMKIENGKLLIKHGELLDPKNDGNLIYKDPSQAEFSEILETVKCK